MTTNEEKSYLQYIREELHKIPELGYQEYKTTKLIEQELSNFGYETTRILETGCVSFLNNNSDKTIAFRSDIDGLPIKEDTNLPFASIHENNMHSCGHDAHSAILLDLARQVKNLKLKVNVLFIFQPAEEGPGGAKKLIENGLFDKYQVDELYGLHVFPDLDSGVVATKPGPLFAKCTEIDIDIIGKSAHAGLAYQGSDAMLASCNLIPSYKQIITQKLSPFNPNVINIGKISGGDARNVVCGDIHLELTVRNFNQNDFDIIKAEMLKINKGIEVSHDVQIKTDIRELYPVLVNDEQIYNWVNTNFDIQTCEQYVLGEDFAFYTNKVPSLFFLLGTRTKQKCYPLHTNKFDLDVKSLKVAVELYIDILRRKSTQLRELETIYG